MAFVYPGKVISRKKFLSTDVGSEHFYSRNAKTLTKPYRKPTPFLRVTKKLVNVIGDKSYGTSTSDVFGSAPTGYDAYTPLNGAFLSGVLADTMNEARSKFEDAMGDKAELAVTIAERKQAVDMVSKRAKQLLGVFKAIRQLDVRGIVKHLGVESTYRRWLEHHHKRVFPTTHSMILRSDLRAMSNLYLEFHFGLQPLISDIVNAADVIFDPPLLDGFLITGTGRKAFSFESSYSGAYYRISATHEGIAKTRFSAVVKVRDPDIFTQNRLGLLNPAGVVLELTKFSFVADWFGNFSQVLASKFDPFAGLTLIDPQYSVRVNDRCVRTYAGRNTEFGPFSFRNSSETQSSSMERYLGIPSVTLRLSKPWSTSLTRAATAISLLVQQGVTPLEPIRYWERKPSSRHKKWPLAYQHL